MRGKKNVIKCNNSTTSIIHEDNLIPGDHEHFFFFFSLNNDGK